jgi:DNA-binding response OmpR family regulator
MNCAINSGNSNFSSLNLRFDSGGILIKRVKMFASGRNYVQNPEKGMRGTGQTLSSTRSGLGSEKRWFDGEVSGMRIAVLDDDVEQLRLVKHTLSGMTDWTEHYNLAEFDKGQDLLRSLKRGETYDLLLLDWMVPDLDGAEILRWVRRYYSVWLPIIIFTSRSGEQDVVTMLEAGADDYITKPLRRMELVSRVRTVLRRSRDLHPGHPTQPRRFGDLELDESKQIARLSDGTVVVLTEKEMRLTLLLFRNAGRPLSREYVLEAVWAISEDNSRRLDTHISHLRRKLKLSGDSDWRLVTVYGVGYRLEATNREAGGST